MSSVASQMMTVPVKSSLPLVVFFEEEHAVRQAIATLGRFRKTTFAAAIEFSDDLERLVVCADQRALLQHQDRLRKPNTRIIALSSHRFNDPRVDGMIYAYVPPDAQPALLERILDNALDHIHLTVGRHWANEQLRNVSREIADLNQIGAALSAEHDLGLLLEMILTKSRLITNADAGSLYLVEVTEDPGPVLAEAAADQQKEEEPGTTLDLAAPAQLAKEIVKKDETKQRRRLRFKLAQNDSIHIPFREMTIEISQKSVAGYVASTGEAVNIDDAYHLPTDVPYSINRKFDEDSGYRTKSILAVPMRNAKGEIVGVLQLINAKRASDVRLTSLAAVTQQVVPFSQRQQDIVTSLASQAAVALENTRLYEDIQRLFEGFVKASVTAIEARDPTTSGHSFRVANLTVALAEAVDRADSGIYKDVHFTREEMREVRYASLLHDFGKVGVREQVLVKAKKLYPEQRELVHQRFQFVKRSIESANYKSRLDYVLERGRDEYLAALPKFDAELAEQIAELDKFWQVILTSDEPTVLPDGNFDALREIADRKFPDWDGDEQSLLTEHEMKLLSIRKGSLDDKERVEIESHVVHTFKFLQQIPWTKEISNIPAIARGHHEKLNGYGYPYKLAAPEIPIQTRIMTISDIFDALSAADRPYKKAVGLDRALQILGFAVKDGEVDAQLFEIFQQARVFEKWKVEPFPY